MNIVSFVLTFFVALLPAHLVSDSTARQVTGSNQVASTVQLPSYESVAVPVQKGSEPVPASANGVYAIDLTTGQALASRHADTQLPIASITKLATALVIVREHKDSQVVTVPTLPAYHPEDEVVGLKAGQRFTIHDLLSALLINSGNDAADALAIIDSGSQTSFAAKMNHLLADWGVPNAHFSNPSGLIDAGNGASPRALATIAQLALHNPTIKQLVGMQEATITSAQGDQLKLKTTDDLLQNGRFSGIKTGYTAAAGQCFVGLTAVQGHQIITVVLGSQDRFGDTERLADWINRNYQWQTPL